MDCLFKTDIEKVDPPYLKHLPLRKILRDHKYIYFAHSIISDLTNRKNYKDIQNISLVSSDSYSKDKLFINYIDPVMANGLINNEMAEIAPDTFHIKTGQLDMTLTSKKPMMLEGGVGYISVCGRESYYYSLTDLETEGTIMIEGKRVKVKGKSWMDHQWADTPYVGDGWTWFSMQLDNGTDIMCCEYDDGKAKDYLIDIISMSAEQFHFKALNLMPGKDVWKSELTKAEYPVSWDIEIPEYDARLHVKSPMKDQEMVFTAINYWEGPIEVSGVIKGQNVSGVGFMELNGYPADFNFLLYSGKEIAKKLLLIVQ